MNNTKSMTENKTNVSYSFRGQEIPALPDIIFRKHSKVLDTDEAIQMFVDMSNEELDTITIEAVHYDDSKQLDTVMLSNGSVITVETAIAFAENDMINGYTTGATRHGGKTLRTVKQGVSLKTLKEF